MESVVSYVNSVEVCRGLSRVCRASVEFYVEVSRPGLWPLKPEVEQDRQDRPMRGGHQMRLEQGRQGRVRRGANRARVGGERVGDQKRQGLA
jgi:hypothetical protein